MIIPRNDSYEDPVEGKVYISPSIKYQEGDDRTIRIITIGIDSPETYETVKIKDEVLLRLTRGGKNKITAKVFEDTRGIYVLKIQQSTAATNSPHKLQFAFLGDEITKLYKFIHDVQVMRFGSDKYQRLSDEDIEHIAVTNKQAVKLFLNNQELFANVVSEEITNEDIVTIGYRKKQLDFFDKLLNDAAYFENVKSQKGCTNESLWQKFFEKNQWIFGYGLGYVFLTGLDDKKLEQFVQGYSVSNRGKRVDALMKTRGIISNLCFVEIKTHTTRLLNGTNPYRPECYAPSPELSGAVSQVQGSVASAIKTFSEKLVMKDSLGNPTGEEIYNYQPKSFLVIGSHSEFDTEHGVNSDMLRSFELYRKNIINPEIITFDELYERARFITQNNEFNNKQNRSVSNNAGH